MAEPVETTRARSPWLAAFGAALAVMSFVAWLQSGKASNLAGAAAFAALSPAWYFIRVSFTEPLHSQWKRGRPVAMPKWARLLALLGAVLLCVSVALQLAA